MKEKVIVCWSGGKDSAMALREIQAMNGRRVTALLTTLTDGHGRACMHGVREELLERQARSLGLPLEKVIIPTQCSDDVYEAVMREAMEKFRAQGVQTVVFGDIFLKDLKEYRERNLAGIGMKAVFPLWKRDTRRLAISFIDLGFRAFLTCVDTQSLEATLAGRAYDVRLLADLPPGVDPCGENGEFHCFVFDGPIFREPVACAPGERLLRDGRYNFCDLIPG